MNKRKVPKIRFKGFYDDWEQRKLKEIADKVTEKNGNLIVRETFTNSAEYGIISQRDFFDHDISNSENIGGYYVVTKEDFVYNPRISATAPVGPINRNKLGRNGVMSPLYTVFRTHDINTEYLEWFFKSDYWHSFMNFNGDSGARSDRFSIKDAVFFEMPIPLPSIDEQCRIGALLNQTNNLITLHQRKLELMKRLRNSLVDRCFIGEKCTMSKLILYHGSPNRVIVPKFGFGEDRHDYGRGFYLTEDLELAKEWAVCRPDETNGWVHKYELEMEGLNILDFQKYDVLSWLAELMKHRDAADSRRYKMLAQKFIEKYGIDTCGYDVITGWRANASYFYIAKEFVRDNIDIEILEELLSLGGLGIQFCIKSERAFAQLSEAEQDIMSVDYSEFNDRYNSGTTTCRAARS